MSQGGGGGGGGGGEEYLGRHKILMLFLRSYYEYLLVPPSFLKVPCQQTMAMVSIAPVA